MEISIRNYQSIADLTLKVVGFTGITGKTNTGKSAMLRAFKGLVEGQLGDEFIRDDTSETDVSVTLGGHVARWLKTRKAVTYWFDGVEYRDAGRHRPKQLDSLGILPLVVNGSEYWPQIQEQHYGTPYLVGESSPGVVSDLLVTDRTYEVYTRATRRADQDASKESLTVKTLEESCRVTKSHLDQLTPLRDQLVQQVETFRETEQRLGKIQESLNDTGAVYARFEKVEKFLEASANVPVWSEFEDLLTKKRRRLEALAKIATVPVPEEVFSLGDRLERLHGLGRRLRVLNDRSEELKDREHSLHSRENELGETLNGSRDCWLCGRERG